MVRCLLLPRSPRWPRFPGYATESLLGRGGFGQVFAARRRRDGQLVAIKLAHADKPLAAARLRHEAEALRTIGPPAVPVLYETGSLKPDLPYLVMERIGWPTLAQQLAGGADWQPHAIGILDALCAVHACGLWHRDLKPDNIFVNPDPADAAARLVDFGLAKRADTAADPAHRTAADLLLGTPAYMSPEQCAAEPDVDARADVYAMGVILYQMVTGRVPFSGPPALVRQAHATRRPLPPSELARVPAALEDVILRCLAKPRERRFADAAVLRQALLAALADLRARACTRRPRCAVVPAPAAPARERRTVSLLFLETEVELVSLREAVQSFGGQLAHAAGARFVFVFGPEAHENPVRRAVETAHALTERGLCARARVDLGPVTVQTRPDGTHRFLCAPLARADRFPQPSDPTGVMLTAAAASGVAEAPVGDPTCARSDTRALVGRESVLAQLAASAEGALGARRPGIATVLAEAGMGKSHLSAALLARLRASAPRLHLLELRAREPVGGDPDDTLRTFLRLLLDLPRAAPDDHGRAILLQRLHPDLGAELWPAVALALGWLEPDHPLVSDLAAAPGALRSAVARAAGLSLRRRAGSAPLCLLLDDAHFADQTTLDALELATLPESEAALWVCVLARPSFERARPRWAERAARHDLIRLGALEPDAAAGLCRRLLWPADNVPAAAIERLLARTRGVPLLLLELVRGLKRQGVVRRHRKGAEWFVATDELDGLPELPLVEWLAERELGTLPPELAAHARLAALLSPEFKSDELEGVVRALERAGAGAGSRAFPLDPGVGLARLLALGILRGHRGDRIGFRHALVREAIARAVAEPLRLQIHRAAYQFYRDAAGLPDRERLPRLAYHAARAGLPAQAAALSLDLADQARRRHAYLDAELCYSRVLELAPPADAATHLRAHRGRGLMRYRIARYEDALADFERARTLAQALGQTQAEIEVLLDHATALDWMDEFCRSRTLVEQASALAAPFDAPAIRARLRMGEGRALWRFSRWAEAQGLLAEAVALADQVGDAAYETLVASLLMLGTVLANRGDPAAAERVFDRVIRLCRKHGDRLHLAAALNNRHHLWVATGERARAIHDLGDYMRIGRELGILRIEYFGEYNLGQLLYRVGDLVAAWPHVRRAVVLEQRRGEGPPYARLLEARLLAFEGRAAQARAVHAEIERQQEAARAAGRVETLLVPAEQLLATLVDLATRDSSAAEWSQLQADASRYAEDQEPVEIADLRGRAALRHGRPEEACQWLEEALALAARAGNLMGDRVRAARDQAALEKARLHGLRASA
ncbi:MAG TPA: protein kinase [Polyangia bacterium]|nr:protein kinase [Polyangia bacterium]